MYPTIAFLLALCFRQNVLSLHVKGFPSANNSRILLNRDTNPTYAIDSSCDRYPQVQSIVNDWNEIRHNTYRRIALQGADPEFEYAFSVVFGTHPDNPYRYQLLDHEEPFTAFEIVSSATRTLASLTLHSNPAIKADLIIYCDDDEMNETPYTAERWQVRPDIPGSPDPNSRKTPGLDQEWFDQYNYMTRPPGSKGCKDLYNSQGERTQMETYYQEIEPFQYGRRLPLPIGLMPSRSTITICDYALTTNDIYPTIGDAWAVTHNQRPPLPLTSPAYGDIASMILYHESTHWAAVGHEDWPLPELDDDGDEVLAYGWVNFLKLPSILERLQNADCYAYLGLLAQYEGAGFVLHPDPAQARLGILLEAPAGWRPP